MQKKRGPKAPENIDDGDESAVESDDLTRDVDRTQASG